MRTGASREASDTRGAALFPFLFLLFIQTLCNSMIIPFMAFFIVEGLGREPWAISVYSAVALVLTISANRLFARRIDAGRRVFPLVGIAGGGYMLAALSLWVWPAFPVVMTAGVLGFGLSSSAVSTMFSLGGNLAERHGIARSRFNASLFPHRPPCGLGRRGGGPLGASDVAPAGRRRGVSVRRFAGFASHARAGDAHFT